MDTPNRRASDPDARTQCYRRLRECMKAGLQQYYIRQHPDLLGDERSQAAVNASAEGLAKMFAVLEDYDISYKQT